MDPITAALQGFDLTNILAAGAAVIVFVLTCVGIKKVAGLVGDEGKEDVVINGCDAELNKGLYEGKRDDERYDYYTMSRFANADDLTENDLERRAVYVEKYGSASDFSEEDQERYSERFAEEMRNTYGDNYFDEDD